MKFGLWYDFRNPPGSGRSDTELYRQTMDQIVLAEELGFDDIWLSEHHFIDDGYLPSCLPMAAAIAARTTRVTIGTNIVLLPFHDPVRLAEDCAVVDVLSGGRFVFGPGRRLPPGGVRHLRRRPPPSRLHHRGGGGDHGALLDRGRVLLPRPPLPLRRRPLHAQTGATAHPDLVRRHRRRGAAAGGAVGPGPVRRRSRTGGVPPPRARVRQGPGLGHHRVRRPVAVLLGGPGPGLGGAGPHALYQLQNYAAWFKAAGQPAFGDPPVDVADLESRGLHLCGTPDQIVASIRASHEAAPFDRHYFWAIWPGVDVAMANRSIELFAREVIPALRDLEDGSRR